MKYFNSITEKHVDCSSAYFMVTISMNCKHLYTKQNEVYSVEKLRVNKFQAYFVHVHHVWHVWNCMVKYCQHIIRHVCVRTMGKLSTFQSHIYIDIWDVHPMKLWTQHNEIWGCITHLISIKSTFCWIWWMN